ncbi:hypothetical protein [Caballeronia sp. BR00000012568055]|uniref:hypothetical protein n=1 Tax=Caballeronia sp. BR00000012568055 TaxID=2918761 RepID=UPI0023F82BB5|nr:hypothetical protein [Caballeronia sp. BR00000012568055]
MNYSEVTKAMYGNPEKSEIRCEILFEGFDKPIAFNAMASDPMAHGQEIFKRLIAGEFGEIADYAPPGEV